MASNAVREHQHPGEGAGHPQAGPIPAPPGFPIAWEQPGDEHGFWTTDRVHFPAPITPLADAFVRAVYHAGFNAAASGYELPLRAAARRINTYHYMAVMPLPVAPEELAALGERSQHHLGAAMGRLAELWRTDWFPAIQGELAAWEAFDLAGADDGAFLAHVEATMARHERLWAIHFAIVMPVLLAMSGFQDLYRDLFGGDDAFDAYRLLQGFENDTLRANRALWRLSRQVVASPALRQLVEATPSSELTAALAQSAEGRALLAGLDAFLAKWGRRGTDFVDLDRPTWAEEPTPAFDALKGFVAGPDTDPDEERALLAAARDALLARTRQRLQGYPQAAVGQFEFFLKAAQEAVVLSEDHGTYIDWRGLAEVRRVLLEAGRRLAACGVIAARDDVFFLTYDELCAALAGDRADRRADVATRRAEMAHFRGVVPPPAIGTMPPGPPPDNPVNRAIMRFFGGPPPVSETPGVIKGHAGSPGRATGRAVVARSLAEASRAQPGDILVTETTAPPWTPLFGVVAGVVTDSGGVLSHSAVVAREYRLPAVVGTGMATAAIPDGALIEVDGDAGTVRLVGAE